MKLSPEDQTLIIKKAVEAAAELIADEIERVTNRGLQLSDAQYDKLGVAVEDDGIRSAVEAFA